MLEAAQSRGNGVGWQWPSRMLDAYYDDYRRLARRVLSGDSARNLMQPTELAHEAALRLFRLERMDIAGRTHFLSLSARVMRQVLIDEVRRFRAQKRQAPPVITEWAYPADGAPAARLDIEAFDDALTRLMAADPERGRIVELRFYAGLTLEEIAETGGLSLATVKRRWRVARAWLLDALT